MLGLRGLAHGAGATAADVRASNVTMLSASEVLKLGAAATAARIPSAQALELMSMRINRAGAHQVRPARLATTAINSDASTGFER